MFINYNRITNKKELIFDKIMRLSDKSLTKKEATFLIENNKDILSLEM